MPSGTPAFPGVSGGGGLGPWKKKKCEWLGIGRLAVGLGVVGCEAQTQADISCAGAW
jgi:hypothetical protein